jgi:hypothetical protein
MYKTSVAPGNKVRSNLDPNMLMYLPCHPIHCHQDLSFFSSQWTEQANLVDVTLVLMLNADRVSEYSISYSLFLENH